MSTSVSSSQNSASQSFLNANIQNQVNEGKTPAYSMKDIENLNLREILAGAGQSQNSPLKTGTNSIDSLMTFLKGLMSMLEQLMTLFQGSPSEKPMNQSPTSASSPTAPQTSSSAASTPSASEASTSGTTLQGESVSSKERSLQAVVDEKGLISVLTNDGYTVRTEGKEEAWDIVSPEGKITRIWGDPHVVESDGDKWNFKDRSTFQFGNNKITVETMPAGNGETLSSNLHIYNGEERVTIIGINKNKPQLISVSTDGRVHDLSLNDGDGYQLTHEKNGDEEWKKIITKKAVAADTSSEKALVKNLQ